jgi:FkbM family methyltransferase
MGFVMLIIVPYFQMLLSIKMSACNQQGKKEKCCSDSYWDALLDSEFLTGNQLMKYLMWTNRTSCQLSHDIGGKMLRDPSGIDGQLAVCIDPQVAPKPEECLVYSFGINDDWSFEEQMEKYGCQVYAFDSTMKVKQHDHTPGIHFYDWGLGDRDEISNNVTYHSLSTIYEKLGHVNKTIDYLKIDTEGSEWRILRHMLEVGVLSQVRQLGIEIHLDGGKSIDQFRLSAKLLRSLENSGMVRFDAKHNPWYKGNFERLKLTGPYGIEIAWYNSKLLHNNMSSAL